MDEYREPCFDVAQLAHAELLTPRPEESLRFFTDYRKTVPKTSQSFPITTVNAGVTVQFKLN